MITFKRISQILIAALLCGQMSACASGSVERAPSSIESPSSESSGPRTHPAAYFMDTFPVSREHNKRPANPNAEFFFKNCSRGGERWPHSRTSYDCSYP